jgi:hypothetical protein
MKRIFVIFALAATLVGCAKEDIVREAPRQAIGFGNPFIENATRAIDGTYSGNKALTTFNVWGTVTGNSNTVNVFAGATCTGNVGMDVWGCDQTEYWIPNCNYNFTAIVDADSNGVATGDYDMPTAITVTSDGTRDLLLATATATTDANGAPSQNPVAFTFAHLMSKAHFTFKNTVGSDNYAFQVTDVKVSDLYTSGTYTIGASTPWSVSAVSTTPLVFGNAVYAEGASSITNGQTATSNYARTFLPATYGDTNKFTVRFTAHMLYKGQNLGSKNYTIEAKHTFEPSRAYNFVIELGAGDEITFKVQNVNGWGETPDITIP